MTDVQDVRSESSSRVVVRPAWSPAQLIGMGAGVVLIVIGAIALARTGTDFSNIPATHAMAAGLSFTCVSAAVQLMGGVLLLASCVYPGSAKSAMAIFGVLFVAWGVVIAADSARLFAVWGYSQSTGVVYIVIGAVLIVAAAISPVFLGSRRQVRRQSPRGVDPTTPAA